MFGLVAEYEEREAARESGYTWKEWEELEREERIACIAYYRLRHIIERNVQDAVSYEQERRARLKGQKTGRRR